MGRINWARDQARRTARESLYTAQANDYALRRMTRPPRVQDPISKAEARVQGAIAMANYHGTKTVRICCACGHSGTASVPVDAEVTLRCSSCGRKISLR